MKDKSCKYFESIFISYLNNNLSNADMLFCKTHLRECSKCSLENDFKEIIHTWELLDEIPEIKPSDNFMLKLQHRIYHEEEKLRLYWLRIDKIFTFAKAPAMACIIFGILLTSNLTYAYTNNDNISDIINKTNRIGFKNSTEKQKRIKEINSGFVTTVNADLENMLKKLNNVYSSTSGVK